MEAEIFGSGGRHDILRRGRAAVVLDDDQLADRLEQHRFIARSKRRLD